MKQCPKCGTTYTDDSLQFCLTDGASLVSSSSAAETVEMSFGNEPMRVNIPQNSAPTVFAASNQPPTADKPPVKKIVGIIIACVVGFFLLLAGVGLAGFVFYKQSGGDNNANNAVAVTSPTPNASPSVSSNDEIERLKRETANLKKQIDDRKNQNTSASPNTTFNPPKDAPTTARANSPRDGFLALRSEPSSEIGYRVAQIPHGATLTVIACPRPSNVGKMPGRWCQVVYNGQSGWAFDAFMTF